MDLPKRKPNRLKSYDYSQNGAYFVTICTDKRRNILSRITVGEGLCALPKNELTYIGAEIVNCINFINNKPIGRVKYALI